MHRIPFIDARFFDPAETRRTPEDALRGTCINCGTPRRARTTIALTPCGSAAKACSPAPRFDEADHRKIGRRAKRLIERREAASGLGHLRSEDRERLGALRDGVELIRIPNEHRADELAAELHAGMPWMSARVS